MKANFIGLRRQAFLALLMSTVSFPANAQFVVDTEYNAQAGLAAIHADVAYNLGLSGLGVKVGVIDGGINPNHSEFTGAIGAGYDYATNSSVLTDPGGHGSHVAGIIGARRNGVGMQGVAYNSSLVIARTSLTTSTLNQNAIAMNDIVAYGARVINNSWGLFGQGSNNTILTFGKPYIDTNYQSLILASQNAAAQGTVVVFTTGNDGIAQPQIMAGLPYYYSELLPTWIAVTSIDNIGAQPFYSNRCGVAANWCIAAPGGGDGDQALTGIYSVDASTSSAHKRFSGTSMAAPHVSGAVALVAERFPWMTGAQLTTTVLTTGTTAATPTVELGRGVLDVGKAVKGPGIFEAAFAANTAGYNSTFSNNISGTGALTKSGDGTLTLSGANTYSGGTTVAGGTLSLGSNTAAGTGSITTTGSVIDYANGIAVANAIVINSNNTQLQTLAGVSATQSGVISETGGARPLEKIGTGTLILTGANTYTGYTTISAGTLALSGTGTIAASSSMYNYGIFDISATTSGTSIAELYGNGSIVLGAKNLNMVNPVSYFTGVISGTGSITLTKTATDSLFYGARLAGANTYTGGTTINNETVLIIGSDGGTGHPDGLTTGSIIGNVVTNGTGVLRFGRSNAYTFSGVISGSGQAHQNGVGTITLTGANTYSGGTTVSAGTLALSGTGSIANSSSLMVNGKFDVSAITSSYSNVVSLSGTGTVALGSKTLVLSAAAGTFSGVISGSAEPGTGGVSIQAGTETLSGVNTFNGITGISSGAKLALSGQGSVSSSYMITANGTFDVSAITGGTTSVNMLYGSGSVVLGAKNLNISKSTSSFSGTISGAGSISITKLPTYDSNTTVILTGINTYTGGTTIGSNTLLFLGQNETTSTGSIVGDVVINDGGYLVFNRYSANAFGGVISGSGRVYQLGSGTTTLTGTNTYTGQTYLQYATLALSGSGSIAASYVYTYGGTFDISATTSGASIKSLQSDQSINGTVTLGSKTLTLTAAADTFHGVISGTGGLNISGGYETLAGANTYTGGTTISAGTLQIGSGGTSGSIAGNVTNNATLAFNRSDSVTFAGIVSGTGALTKSGDGTLTLSGANTYSGGTTVAGGTLSLGSNTAAGTGSITTTGSVIDYANGIAVANAIVINSNNTQLQTLAGVSATQSGVISETGGARPLEKIGTGTLILTGANTYSGGTTVSAGTLQIGSGSTTGSISGNVTNNAAIAFNRSDSVTFAGIVSGTGALTQSGAGTTILTGTNTYSGGTTVSAGTLQIGSGSTSGSIAGNVTNNAAIAFNRSDSVTFAGIVSGTGSLTQSGTGTTILTAANTYSGGTTVSGGILQIGSGGTTGSISGNVTNNATLAFNRSDSVTFAGVVSGTGALTQAGNGTTILTGTNTYSGGTTVTGGLINFTALSNFGTGNITINGGGLQWGAGTVLDVSARLNSLGALGGTFDTNGNAVTLASVVSGTGALTKSGAGTLTLTAANTYSGGTTISAGTLQIGSGGTTGSTAGNIKNNATLIFNRSDDISFGGVISGTGTVIKNSANNMVFTGANTYSGATTINAGTLSVNGSIASPVTVANGATLKGSGSVGSATISSGATMAPGNSIGLLTVNGNITFAAGSIYEVEVNNASQADRITATGGAAINGGTVQVLAAMGDYSVANTYTVLSAAGGVTGTFSNLILNNNSTNNLVFLNGSFAYTSNAVALTIKQSVTFPSIARTPNEFASATAIQAGGAGSGALYTALINSTSVAVAQTAFDAASGEVHATLLAGQLDDAALTRSTVLNRMRAKQDYEAGWSLWGSVSGDFGSMDSDGNAAYAKRSGVNITAGADTSLDENWRGGFEGGFSSGQLNVAERASSADLQSGHIGAYAHGRYDAVSLRLGGSYGFGTAKTIRAISFENFNDTAGATQDTAIAQLFGEVGYEVALETVTLEPFVGIAWSHLNAGAFRESGGSAALSGTSRDMGAVFSTLGLAATVPSVDLSGAALTPSLRVGWQHAFTNNPASRTLSFISSAQAFTVLGTPLDADRAVIDVGAALALSGDTEVTLGYTGTLGTRSNDHSVRLMGTLKF